MSFFARPDLSDIQFRQLTGSTLTMSGNTDFTGVLKSKGIEIDATSGITTSSGDALVFNGIKIVLTPISGGSGGMYYGNTPASITLGGISSGTTLTGKTLSKIIEELLVPELYPILIAPSYTFSIPLLSNPYEVGCQLTTLSFCSTYNKGSISPSYGTNGFRSGNVTCYTYLDFYSSGYTCTTSALNNLYSIPTFRVLAGNRNAYGCVTTLTGQQPSGSTGTPYCAPYGACTKVSSAVSICGLYPYFY